jgi:hypothetical protein
MRRELVQEIKHEAPAPAGHLEEDPSGFDIYTGRPPLQLAHVSTQAFGGEGPQPKHLRHSRFTALRRKK